MKKYLVVLLTLLYFPVLAQNPVSSRLSSGADVGAAFKANYLSPSIAYYQLLNLDNNQIFSVGWHFKFSTVYANQLDYTTAPLKLTRGTGGLSGPVIAANIDTLSFNRVTMTTANFGLRAQVRLGPVQLGGSADIIGFGFGKGRSSTYRSSTGYYKADSTTATFADNPNQPAQPQKFNLRLLGDNDRGTLAMDVYARVLVSRRLGVKVGYQWITTEMRASNANVEDGNSRFRNRSAMPYVALTFPFF